MKNYKLTYSIVILQQV